MKNVINGIGMAFIALMVIAAAMVISGRSVRKNELEKATEHAAEQAIEHLDNTEGIQVSREEFIQDFLDNLLIGIESDSEVKVSIMAADPEKRILSVQAEEEFQNPLGRTERVVVQRTIIVEKYSLLEN